MENSVQNVPPSGRRSRSESIESIEMNVKRAFLPTTIVGWIFGFGIIEYPLGHPRSYISILYTLLVNGLTLIANTYGTYSMLLQAYEEGSINLLFGLFFILNFIYVISMFFNPLLHWINQKKIKSFLRRFAEIKMEINQLKCNENDVRALRLKKNQILIVIMGLLFVTSQIIAYLFQNTNFFLINLIMEVFYLFSSSINDIMFINCVTSVKWEFVELNEKMTELFSTLEEKLSMENSNDSLEENTQDYCGLIKTTRRLHFDLVKLSRRVNNTYGISILLSLLMSTIFQVFALYNVYTTVQRFMNGNEFTVYSILDPVWIAFFGSKILLINLTSARTINEAHEIRYVNMKFNIEAISKRMELETRLFTLQLLQNPLTFTAEELFDLGHSFILLVISIIVAYLSLLIQSSNVSMNYVA